MNEGQAGDGEPAPTYASFDEFFAREFAPLVRVLCAADSMAEDAVQDAFYRASVHWTKIARYDDPAAWVRRVAVNRLTDHRRSGLRRDRALAALAETSRDEAVATDDVIDLADAISQLPQQQRVALSLFYLGGFTSADTAAAMGLSDGAVRFHLHQARAALRHALEVRHA